MQNTSQLKRGIKQAFFEQKHTVALPGIGIYIYNIQISIGKLKYVTNQPGIIPLLSTSAEKTSVTSLPLALKPTKNTAPYC